MTPDEFLTRILDPGLQFVASIGGPQPTIAARRFLLAVALQESGPNLEARYQNSPAAVPGPARGWWQFEQGGGVNGVLTHPNSQALAQTACNRLFVVPDGAACWRAIEGHDLLATAFARLLLWTDPPPIPTTEQAAWDCYANRLWRPGAPRRNDWTANWATAQAAVAANPLRRGARAARRP